MTYNNVQVNNPLKNNNYQLFFKKVSMSINQSVYCKLAYLLCKKLKYILNYGCLYNS